jgi:hypothetical protein
MMQFGEATVGVPLRAWFLVLAKGYQALEVRKKNFAE